MIDKLTIYSATEIAKGPIKEMIIPHCAILPNSNIKPRIW